MRKYEIVFSRQAHKDIKLLSPKLKEKAKEILQHRISIDPYSGKALTGSMKGYYSVRLSFKDRIVYSVDETRIMVFVLRAKTHYGE